jgi:hypothetical protein
MGRDETLARLRSIEQQITTALGQWGAALHSLTPGEWEGGPHGHTPGVALRVWLVYVRALAEARQDELEMEARRDG